MEVEGDHTHQEQYSHPVLHLTENSSCNRFSRLATIVTVDDLYTFAVSNYITITLPIVLNVGSIVTLCIGRVNAVKKPGSRPFCLLKNMCNQMNSASYDWRSHRHSMKIAASIFTNTAMLSQWWGL